MWTHAISSSQSQKMGCGASCRPFNICSRWYWKTSKATALSYVHNNTMMLWPKHCPMYTTIPWCCDLCTVLRTQHYHDVVTYALSYAHNTMMWPMHCPTYTTIPWCCDICTVLWTQHYHDVVTHALSYAHNTMMLWPMHCPTYTTIPWCCDLCTVLCTQQYHDVVTYALSYVRNNTMMWPMHCPMYATIPWCCDGGEACGTRSVELWSGPSRHCLGQSQPWQRALWPWGGRSRVSGCHWTASGCACWATPSESASRITHLLTLDTIPLNFSVPFCSMLNKGWHLYQLLA